MSNTLHELRDWLSLAVAAAVAWIQWRNRPSGGTRRYRTLDARRRRQIEVTAEGEASSGVGHPPPEDADSKEGETKEK